MAQDGTSPVYVFTVSVGSLSLAREIQNSSQDAEGTSNSTNC